MKNSYSYKIPYNHQYVVEPLPLSENARLDLLDSKLEKMKKFDEANNLIQKIKKSL